jgi:hypothetical protein
MTKPRKSSKASIVNYWRTNRPILFHSFNANRYGNPEETCWACGYKSTCLERCHLKAKNRGGTLHPNNLVLLCGECHHKAPSVLKKRYMIKWILEQKPFEFVEFSYALDLVRKLGGEGMTSKQFSQILNILKKEIQKADLHHGRLSLASKLACIEESFRQFQLQSYSSN